MPTIITHAAVPLALACGLGRDHIPGRLLLAGIVAAMLPDLDVLAFRLGIAYQNDFGHRGFSHSPAFALTVAAVGALLTKFLRVPAKRAFWFLAAATLSHGVLDAFTNGGFGIAFLWPFSGERFFAPVRPIAVSPLSLSRFLSERGLSVLASEVQYVWLPCLALLGLSTVLRYFRQR
ncbi:metal-dependent hydrolase [Methylomonas rhizoryzae]|uniref:metal-dependent hydrolase n=1 Tax=Methylomonas rhizoryzae TaxID=2608981 RepID=UPI001232ADB8|nr:metal-dependent hydrolase [Methylomonas rhizoryzae]